MAKLNLADSRNFLSNNHYNHNEPMDGVLKLAAAVDDNEIEADADSSPPSSIEENSGGYVNC